MGLSLRNGREEFGIPIFKVRNVFRRGRSCRLKVWSRMRSDIAGVPEVKVPILHRVHLHGLYLCALTLITNQ